MKGTGGKAVVEWDRLAQQEYLAAERALKHCMRVGEGCP